MDLQKVKKNKIKKIFIPEEFLIILKKTKVVFERAVESLRAEDASYEPTYLEALELSLLKRICSKNSCNKGVFLSLEEAKELYHFVISEMVRHEGAGDVYGVDYRDYRIINEFFESHVELMNVI